MKPIKNWNDIKPSGSFERLAPGGYCVKITGVKDDPKKEYLEILYDIISGPEAGRFSDPFYADKPYAHRFMRSYKETALGMFKAFIEIIEQSNPGYSWEAAKWKEATLVGKVLGIVLGEEEYRTNRGDVNIRLYVKDVKTVDDINAGNFTVPALKPLKEEATDGMVPAPDVTFSAPSDTFSVPLSDDDIPF